MVTADRYGATTATFTAYQREGGEWRRVFGPWTARIGTRGLAPPGEKREGDGRTPSGVYGFDFLFGVSPDPGVKFPYRRVTNRIVWDDDPASPLYNTWVDLDRQQAGAEPEPMFVSPVYDHGAVIAYNTDRTPGAGQRHLHARLQRRPDRRLRVPAVRPARGGPPLARPEPEPQDRPRRRHLTDTGNISVLVPEAEPIVAEVNRRMPGHRRLTAPAHITLVYPFMPASALSPADLDDLGAFFSDRPTFGFDLALGWFGREVLILRPDPASELVELTRAIVGRWPAYPYYGGLYDVIEPHVSLAFGTADELVPLALSVGSLLPLRVQAEAVTLLVGPEEQMRPGPSFPLRSAGAR